MQTSGTSCVVTVLNNVAYKRYIHSSDRNLSREQTLLDLLGDNCDVPNVLPNFRQEYTLALQAAGPDMDFWMRSRPGYILDEALFMKRLIVVLKGLHRKRVIHRDIKPANIVFRTQRHFDANDIFSLCVIDFGLSELRQDVSPPFSYAGTPRFSSLASHFGAPPSPRDDLESLAYTCIRLQKGTLPWENFSSKQRLEEIGNCKKEFPVRALCLGMNLCNAMVSYIEYLRELDPEATIDYHYLFRLFCD